MIDLTPIDGPKRAYLGMNGNGSSSGNVRSNAGEERIKDIIAGRLSESYYKNTEIWISFNGIVSIERAEEIASELLVQAEYWRKIYGKQD